MKYLFTLFLLAFSFAIIGQDSTNYTIYYSNRHAGFVKIKRFQNGSNTVHFMYNDRGRGPDQTFEILINQQKGIEALEQKGVGYNKDTVSMKIIKKNNEYLSIRGKDSTRSSFKTLNLYGFGNSGLYEFFFPLITDTLTHGSQGFVAEKILPVKNFVLNWFYWI